MRVEVIQINALSDSLKQDWLRIQASNPSFAGPFFHPELFLTVAKYYPDLYLAILYKDNIVSGFLPFKKDHRNLVAKPIRFCNYEGIISSPEQYWDMNLILKLMGLRSWEFDAMVNFKNISSIRGEHKPSNSFNIDLTCGLEEYWNFIKNKKIELKTLITKQRSLENKVGALRFVASCDEIEVLYQFVKWISDRYKHDAAWLKETTSVLELIYQLKDPLFKGILSALYAGDELLAVNFALRCHEKLGGIFMAFNPNFPKYSVGIILLHELINNHKALGYNIYDLGPGNYQYKQDYSNRIVPIIEGDIRIDSLKEKIKSVDWLHQSLLPIARLKGKIVTKLSQRK